MGNPSRGRALLARGGQDLHADRWPARIGRQKEIDAVIAKRADVELLYNCPYEDKTKVRVAGPFTVEGLSPQCIVPSDADALADDLDAAAGRRRRNLASPPPTDFAQVVLENLKTSGVQQGAKADRITFTSLVPWPGEYVAAGAASWRGRARPQSNAAPRSSSSRSSARGRGRSASPTSSPTT